MLILREISSAQFNVRSDNCRVTRSSSDRESELFNNIKSRHLWLSDDYWFYYKLLYIAVINCEVFFSCFCCNLVIYMYNLIFIYYFDVMKEEDILTYREFQIYHRTYSDIWVDHNNSCSVVFCPIIGWLLVAKHYDILWQSLNSLNKMELVNRMYNVQCNVNFTLCPII